ncbi:putative PHP domain protein [Paratrimastix pyriformis]|uniref:PHP domain protein n=1 Tax=Paratrimastix pyriformis TaxID=342808 RepID=A0ABQ8V139_9EUKA|nr:putative PHP domain protein [Paratrimastix pyriformis]
MLESLHNHTTASDGEMSHETFLNEAAANGIGIVGFTDHDSLPSLSTVTHLRDLSRENPALPKWIVGIEMSSGLPKELGGQPYSGLHIVGIFVNPENQTLIDHCARSKQARIERMAEMVANLRRLGFSISEADCLLASEGESVGRPHIVRALVWHPPVAKCDQPAARPPREPGCDGPAEGAHAPGGPEQERYQRILDEPTQEPYTLFLADGAFIPGVYVEYKYTLDMDSCVRLIREAGGLAILAHPCTCKSKIPLAMAEQMLAEGRFDGIEVVFGKERDAADRAAARDIAERLRTRMPPVVMGGGGDIHTLEGMREWSAAPWAQQTRGLLEALLAARPDLKTTWSSLAQSS